MYCKDSFTRRPLLTILSMLLALILAVLACDSSEPEVSAPEPTSPSEEAQPVATEPAEPVEVVEPTNTAKPLGSARSNPAPVGYEVKMGDIKLIVKELIRPATEIVMSANMFNTEPEEGQEYIFVNISVTCGKDSDSTCNISDFFQFSLVGSAGVSYNPEIFISDVSGLFEGGEFFGGATKSGYLPFIISQDETDMVLIYDEILGGKAFLSVDK